MARRTSKIKQFLAGGASGALAGSQFGPKGAAAGFFIGGALNAAQESPEFDASGLSKRPSVKSKRMRYRRSRDLTREIGTAGGTDFAGRNIGGGLRTGIIQGQQRFQQQATLDRLSEMEFALERDIMDAQYASDREAIDAVER